MQILMPYMTVFDRFMIIEDGKGSGQSFVYRGIDLDAPPDKPWLKDVFIKQYRDVVIGTDESESLMKQFDTMENRLGAMKNYMCLPIYIGKEANSVIAIYPWVEGTTLQNYMEKGMKDSDEIVRMSVALTKTVLMLHNNNIAHLDLKPANIIVENNRKYGKIFIRVIDFDSARIDGVGLRSRVMGTEGYLSPEHAFPDIFGQVSARSDVFTLGIMLYELLFKDNPFAHTDDYYQAIANEAFALPKGDYHWDVVEIILTSLSANPFLRPDASDILYTLNNHYSNSLKAINPSDRWTQSNLYVQIEGQGKTTEFIRSYYETTDLDRSQFRGAKINVDVTFLRLIRDKGWLLKMIGERTGVMLNGKSLKKGDYVRLTESQSLNIGSENFIIKTIPY